MRLPPPQAPAGSLPSPEPRTESAPNEGRSLLSRRWAYGRWRGLSAVAPLALSLWLSPPLQAKPTPVGRAGRVLISQAGDGAGALRPADLVLRGAQIITMDPAQPQA
ncbi:MAG TPA: hypothetical protein PKI03_38495, partial [Pseudomonadota bacterium]|nr:hypothetical protein [Pseudomonadota bacterium]